MLGYATIGTRDMARAEAFCGARAGADELHAKALELGATEEGAPGERLPVFHDACTRDLDGDKLCFVEMKLG